MKIDNPFQMNDWGIKRFLVAILVIQIAMWMLTALDTAGLHVPFLTQAVGFIYLTFVPGIIILRILRLHKLGSIPTILFSVALSIAFLMLIGLAVNSVYPLLGVTEPLSTWSLIITIYPVVFVLFVLSYIRDRDFADPNTSCITLKQVLAPPALLLALLPLLSILGVNLVFSYGSNALLMVMIVMIAVVVILASLGKFITKEYFPLAIVMIAFALLYHTSITQFLQGSDIQVEYYVGRVVEANSFWDSSFPLVTFNSMLSITILPVVFSRLLSIELLWVYKLVFPILATLLPLGIYALFQRYISEKMAFLSVFVFMAFLHFIAGLILLTRMQIAYLFFVPILLLTVSKELQPGKRAILFIIFSSALVVSHYGLLIYLLFYLFMAWLFPIFWYKTTKDDTKMRTLSITFIMVITVIALSWYMYVSGGIILGAFTGQGVFVLAQLSDLFSPESRDPLILQALGLSPVGQAGSSFWREMGGWFNRITYLMIITGVFTWFVRRRKMKWFPPEYMGMALAGLLTMLAAIVIPFFSYAAMSTTRIYFISLFFLAPFLILGGQTIFALVKKVFSFNRPSLLQTNDRALIYITIIALIPYFLFNTGFIFEVTGDRPSSVSLGYARWQTIENLRAKSGFANYVIEEQDVFGSRWISSYWDENEGTKIFGDYSAIAFLLRPYGQIQCSSLRHIGYPPRPFIRGYYLFLRSYNTRDDIMAVTWSSRKIGASQWMVLLRTSELKSQYDDGDLAKIYSNRGSEIYYIQHGVDFEFPEEPPEL